MTKRLALGNGVYVQNVTPLNLAHSVLSPVPVELEPGSYSAPSRVMPRRAQYDALPFTPNKKTAFKSESDVVKSQPVLHASIVDPIKGIGYCPVGSPFDIKPRKLKHQFSFDLNTFMGVRAYTANYVRHGRSSYVDTDTDILSPALSSSMRIIDNVRLYSSMRDASYQAIPLAMSTSLWDLEAASWNANPLKLNYEPSSNPVTTAQGPTALVPLNVFSDYMPSTDHNKFTPFPGANKSVDAGQVRKPPFLVNLGPGSVSYTFLNRLPTAAEVELVVFQPRLDDTSITLATASGWMGAVVSYSNTTYTRNLQGPVLTTDATGSGGEAPASTASTTDPSVKFLATYPKWSLYKPPMIEKQRKKFLLAGGATKTIKFHLPPRVYNSLQNANSTGDPFAATVALSANLNAMSYCIFIAVNGVLMPVFSAPASNNSNAATATDYMCQSIVDRQTGPASVVVTGEYSESPKPCLTTRPISLFNNLPELNDTSVVPLPIVNNVGTQPTGDTTLYADRAYLVSGYVQDLPMSTSVGQVVSFGSTMDNNQEPMDGN